jgi:hypothetical protein
MVWLSDGFFWKLNPLATHESAIVKRLILYRTIWNAVTTIGQGYLDCVSRFVQNHDRFHRIFKWGWQWSLFTDANWGMISCLFSLPTELESNLFIQSMHYSSHWSICFISSFNGLVLRVNVNIDQVIYVFRIYSERKQRAMDNQEQKIRFSAVLLLINTDEVASKPDCDASDVKLESISIAKQISKRISPYKTHGSPRIFNSLASWQTEQQEQQHVAKQSPGSSVMPYFIRSFPRTGLWMQQSR